MEKRVLLVLAFGCMTLWLGEVSAQETGTGEGGEGQPETAPEEAPAEAAPAEEAPAEEAPASEAAEEAPAAEAATEEPAGDAAEETAAEGEDDEAEDDGEEKKTPFRRPFAGTSFYWSNEFTAISLDRGYDYTYNPVYSMGFGLAPMWAVHPDFALSSNIGFMTELTNSDFANKRGEVYFLDVPITGSYSYSVDVNDDVKFGTGFNVSLLIPTSKMSRYATLYTSIGVGTKAAFTFTKVLEGLTLSWKPKFTKYIHGSENPVKEDNPLDESGIPESEKLTSPQYQSLVFGGGENPSWSIANGLSLSLGIVESLSFSFGYTHRYTYKYSAQNTGSSDDEEGCRYTIEGCDIVRDTGNNERGIYSQTFSYNLTYMLPDPASMVSLSLGAITASNQLGPDGSYRTPFFNRETMITFGLSLDIDAAVSALQGDEEE